MRWFGWFRGDPKKDDIKKAAGAYKRIMDLSNADKTKLTDTNEQSNNFLDTHSEVIDTYIQNFADTKSDDQNIENLLNAYFRRFPDKKPAPPLSRQDASSKLDTSGGEQESSAGKQESGSKQEENKAGKSQTSKEDREKLDAELSTVLEDSELNIKNDDKKEDHEKLSKGINPSAMKGLKNISCWMLRNGAKTGAYSGNEKIRFVTKGVLGEDARVKLFAYYLVEHGMQKESNPDALKAALAESQTNYVPDLAAFKDKMIASKFKFWKRFNASHFNWEKLSAAIRLAIKNRNLLKPFGTLGHEVSSSDQADEDEEDQTAAGGAQAGQQKTGQAQTTGKKKSAGSNASAQNKAAGNPATASLTAAVKAREQNLKNYMDAGKELMRMRKELSEKPHQDEMNKKAAINTQLAAVKMLFEDLKNSDQNVQNVFETLVGTDFVDTPEKEEEKSKAEKVGEGAEKVNTVLGLTEKPGEIMGTYNTAARFANKLNPAWNIAEIPDSAVNYMDNLGPTSDILSIAGSAISAFNLVLKIIKIHEERSTMTTGTLILEGMDAFSEAFSIATDLTQTIMSLLSVSEAIVDTTTGAFSAVTGAINIVSGAATLAVMADQRESLGTAQEKLKGDSKAQKMVRLGKRTTRIQQEHAAAKIVAGSVELVGGVLTATGVSAVAGVVLGSVGSVIELTSDVVKYFQNRQNMKDTIDDYINMDKMMDIITKSVKDKSSLQTDEVKKQLRIEMAARLHYADIDELYDAIIDEYAAYIYTHIFFEKGNLSKPLSSKTKENEGYIDLLAGFGAEPDFSKKKPGPKAIAEYLKKV